MHTKIKTYFSALTRVSFVFFIFAFASCGLGAGKTCNKDNNDKAEPYNSAGEPNSEKMIVMKFDIKAFNANSKYGVYKFIDTNGAEVEQTEESEFPSGKVTGYYEYRKYPNSPYEYYNEYNASGNIIKSSTSFYNTTTGIAKEYDSAGNIIKETDFDSGYPFSIAMLIEKMKEEYEIDLLNKKNKVVYRFLEQKYLHILMYRIEHSVDIPPKYRDIYLIDGKTGEMLYRAKRPFREDVFNKPEPVEAEYANSKKAAE